MNLRKITLATIRVLYMGPHCGKAQAMRPWILPALLPCCHKWKMCVLIIECVTKEPKFLVQCGAQSIKLSESNFHFLNVFFEGKKSYTFNLHVFFLLIKTPNILLASCLYIPYQIGWTTKQDSDVVKLQVSLLLHLLQAMRDKSILYTDTI